MKGGSKQPIICINCRSELNDLFRLVQTSGNLVGAEGIEPTQAY